MDIARITPFIQSVHHVFETMLQLQVEVGEPQWVDASGTPHDVSVVADVAGNLEGKVALSLDQETADRILALFTGLEVARESADLADAACELLGMICGAACAWFPDGQAVFSIPIMVHGVNPLAASVRNGAPAIVLPCATDCGHFVVEFSLEDRAEVGDRTGRPVCAGA